LVNVASLPGVSGVVRLKKLTYFHAQLPAPVSVIRMAKYWPVLKAPKRTQASRLSSYPMRNSARSAGPASAICRGGKS
jgi:hypothetical protein